MHTGRTSDFTQIEMSKTSAVSKFKFNSIQNSIQTVTQQKDLEELNETKRKFSHDTDAWHGTWKSKT